MCVCVCFLSLSQTLALTFLPIFSSKIFFFFFCTSRFLSLSKDTVLDTMRPFHTQASMTDGRTVACVRLRSRLHGGKRDLNARSHIRLQADFRPDQRHQNAGHQEKKKGQNKDARLQIKNHRLKHQCAAT